MESMGQDRWIEAGLSQPHPKTQWPPLPWSQLPNRPLIEDAEFPGLRFAKRDVGHQFASLMKTFLFSLIAVLALSSSLHAEDGNLADQLRRALDKAKVKLGDVAEKAGEKGRQWYHQAKENLKLSRPEYSKRAEKKLADIDAQVAVLKEIASGAGQRDYFKTRVTAIDQHMAYAKNEFITLQAADTEPMFRARQSIFNKTLWTLEAAVEQAQEEAGL